METGNFGENDVILNSGEAYRLSFKLSADTSDDNFREVRDLIEALGLRYRDELESFDVEDPTPYLRSIGGDKFPDKESGLKLFYYYGIEVWHARLSAKVEAEIARILGSQILDAYTEDLDGNRTVHRSDLKSKREIEIYREIGKLSAEARRLSGTSA